VAGQLLEYCAGLVTRWRGADYLASLYTEMHSKGAFPGDSWRVHVDTLRRLVPQIDGKTILDYGCGRLGGLSREFGERVIPYDPFVAQYSTPPWDKKFDVVFSSDVFEHMKLSAIDELLERIRAARPEFVFLNISTRPAHKLLPNGANAHLTVRPAAWWLEHLGQSLGADYCPVLAEADLLRDEGTFCFQRSEPSRA
jgi:hypothetical protein